jgi:hypothetical protein
LFVDFAANKQLTSGSSNSGIPSSLRKSVFGP